MRSFVVDFGAEREVEIYCHPFEQDLAYDFRNLQLICVYL